MRRVCRLGDHIVLLNHFRSDIRFLSKVGGPATLPLSLVTWLRRELTLLFRAVGHLDRQHLGGGIDAHDFASGPHADRRKENVWLRLVSPGRPRDQNLRRQLERPSLRSNGISIAREAHMAKKAAAKKTRKKAAKRELIDTRSDKRYVRRRAKGRFKESDDVGKSLVQDRRTKAQTKVKIGQGDKGDR